MNHSVHGQALDRLLGLAYRRLRASGVVIIDTTTESASTRTRFQTLAASFGAEFNAIVCVCSDPDVHRRRAEMRRRDIPGWHDAGDWSDIQQQQDRLEPWPGATTIDTAQPMEDCVLAVRSALDNHTSTPSR